MGITPKVHRGYRLKQETADTIEAIARGQGLRSQAEVIDQWADEWAKKNGARKVAGQVSVPGKKSGGARKVLPVVAGTFTADKLTPPANKKEVHAMNAQGQIERKPFLKPSGRL